MKQQTLIPHLFRTEFGKITAVLCKLFGIDQMEIAEDIASETFVQALETWPHKGIPENPTAWLYVVAKNKAINHFNREDNYTKKIAPDLKSYFFGERANEIDWSGENIKDSLLEYVVCYLPPLYISGSSNSFVSPNSLRVWHRRNSQCLFKTGKDTINKRLFRAKEKLRKEKITLSFPDDFTIVSRLENVLLTLYLLFNEGYYSETNDEVIRKELCLEAMRLTNMLAENEKTNLSETNALLALMCFHASRLDARKGKNGEIILYDNQDQTLWNKDLIAKGIYFLHLASKGFKITRYHLEAAIAYWHTQKVDLPGKWENILKLYNQLLIVHYSPIAALNRTFALFKIKGRQAAIAEAEKLNLSNNHYYFVLLAELYDGIDKKKTKKHLENALLLAKTNADKQTILTKLKKYNH